MRRLGLDEVWWLVSPQNPLKARAGMADLATRVAAARAVAAHRRIRVGALETGLGTVYTVDTLAALTRRLPRARFVWLMGADNLAQINRWQGWTRIFHMVPIAVLDRPSYSLGAAMGRAARRFARFRRPKGSARLLASAMPPAWVLLRGRRHPASASAIRANTRKTGGGRAHT